MKKRLFTALMIMPLLGGCYGNYITKDKAKEINAHILTALNDETSEDYVKDEDYSLGRYSLTQKSVSEGITRETKELFNDETYFYHSYVITIDKESTNKIDELWEYLTVDDDRFYYYHVERKDGAVNELNFPVYTVTRYNYSSNEAMLNSWNEFVNNLKSTTRAKAISSSNSVNGIIKKIEDDNGIAVAYYFRSLDGNSVYVDARYTENEKNHHFEISIEYLHPTIFHHYVSEDDYSECYITYGALADRLEPDLTYSSVNDVFKD